MDVQNITIEALREDPDFIEFIEEGRPKKAGTIKNYEGRLLKYCNFCNMLPSKLVEEAEKEQDAGVKPRRRKVRKRLTEFRRYMEEEEGHSPKSVKTVMTIVKGFYAACDIEVYRRVCNSTKNDHNNKTSDNIPNIKQLEMVITKATPKYKAMISLAMSSGMGQAEIRHLKVSDYLKAYGVSKLEDIDEETIPEWNIRRIKKGNEYFTFSSPESTRYINLYLHSRENIEPDDYLFCRNDIIDGKRVVAPKKPMRDTVVSTVCARLNDYCKFEPSEANGKWRFFHFHALREFFRTTALHHGMPERYAEWCLGHKRYDIVNTYAHADREFMKNEYIRILPFLSIAETNTMTIQSKEYKELSEENAELRKQIKEIQKFMPNLDTLKRMEQLMGEFDKHKDMGKFLKDLLEAKS